MTTTTHMTRILVMDTRSLADAKAHLSEIVDSVEETQEHVAITRRGRPAAVLMSVGEYEGLMETLDLMATPGAVDEIKAAHVEVVAGTFLTAAELRAKYLKK